MKYEDALVDCLTALEAGNDLESALRAHPEHAVQLRDDLSLVRELRQLPDRLPIPAGAAQRAQSRLEAELATQRRAASAPTHGGGGGSGWLGFLSPGSFLASGLVGAAIVLVLAVGLSIAGGGSPDPTGVVRAIVGSPSTAEAAFDGVVVENANGVLTLQTQDGLATVKLANAATITDETGATVAVAALAPGQVIDVKGKKLANGTLNALSVQRHPLNALEDWCAGHPSLCGDLKGRLQSQLTLCQQHQLACPGLQENVSGLNTRSAELANRLQDLQTKCQQNRLACQDLRAFCDQHPDLCKGIAQRIANSPVAQELRDQLRDLAKRCEQNRAQCASLTTFCQHHADLCHDLRPPAHKP